MAKISYEQYVKECKRTATENALRLGQCLERQLYEVHNDLHYEVVCLIGVDPFYSDDWVPFFLEIVKERWSKWQSK